MSKIDKLGVWIFMLNDELKKCFGSDYAFTISGAGKRIAYANSLTNGAVVTPDDENYSEGQDAQAQAAGLFDDAYIDRDLCVRCKQLGETCAVCLRIAKSN